MSALISASEASIIAVNKIRIKHLSQEGNRRAKLISKIQDNFEDFFATILFIGNLLNITVATIGTSLAINIIGENSATAILIASLVTTIVIVEIGELTPKAVSTINPEKWALATSDIVRDAPVPVGGALKVIAGQKLVLEASDKLYAHCSSANNVDVVASVLADVS